MKRKGTEFYEKKRKEIKVQKRAMADQKFKSADERKSRVQTLKREYRALKRSEDNEIRNMLKNLG